MKKLFFAVIVAAAVVGSVAFTTLYDQPAKAGAGLGIDPSQMMMNARGLPAATYVDYSVVYN